MLPWTLVNETLTVVLTDGSAKTVNRAENPERFDDTLQAIKDDDWDRVETLVCPVSHLDSFSDGHIQYDGSCLRIDGEEVPLALGQKIIDYSSQNFPYQPLVAFWNNLKQNPSYRAVQGLFQYLERNKYPITPGGNFIAYKGVQENWTDCRTGTIDNSVGKTVSMPRNKVNEDPEQTCSYGLHVANWDYAHQLYGSGGSGGGHTIMVEVNPRDVVAVPVDYNFAKIRVCEYVVKQEVFHQSDKELEGDYTTYDTDRDGLNCSYEEDEDFSEDDRYEDDRYEDDYEDDDEWY